MRPSRQMVHPSFRADVGLGRRGDGLGEDVLTLRWVQDEAAVRWAEAVEESSGGLVAAISWSVPPSRDGAWTFQAMASWRPTPKKQRAHGFSLLNSFLAWNLL